MDTPNSLSKILSAYERLAAFGTAQTIMIYNTAEKTKASLNPCIMLVMKLAKEIEIIKKHFYSEKSDSGLKERQFKKEPPSKKCIRSNRCLHCRIIA